MILIIISEFIKYLLGNGHYPINTTSPSPTSTNLCMTAMNYNPCELITKMCIHNIYFRNAPQNPTDFPPPLLILYIMQTEQVLTTGY